MLGDGAVQGFGWGAGNGAQEVFSVLPIIDRHVENEIREDVYFTKR
jgi:hypothetical protein